MTSRQNDEYTTWVAEKMISRKIIGWQNDKLTKCQFDELTQHLYIGNELKDQYWKKLKFRNFDFD